MTLIINIPKVNKSYRYFLFCNMTNIIDINAYLFYSILEN